MIVVSVLTTICFIVVHYLIDRLAITIGILFTIAATLDVIISLRTMSLPPLWSPLSTIATLLCVLGIGPMFITVPLTLHRSTTRLVNESKRPPTNT
ncbi:MAG: hypothetical protein L0228_13255 [Planctomycetes bacterium]|nr:hypothetical protein [Planctomycetota bacterium]